MRELFDWPSVKHALFCGSSVTHLLKTFRMHLQTFLLSQRLHNRIKYRNSYFNILCQIILCYPFYISAILSNLKELSQTVVLTKIIRSLIRDPHNSQNKIKIPRQNSWWKHMWIPLWNALKITYFLHTIVHIQKSISGWPIDRIRLHVCPNFVNYIIADSDSVFLFLFQFFQVFLISFLKKVLDCLYIKSSHWFILFSRLYTQSQNSKKSLINQNIPKFTNPHMHKLFPPKIHSAPRFHIS